MTYKKTKAGLLIASLVFIFAILALYIPGPKIFFTFLIGLLVIPILALAIILIIGAARVIKTLKKPSKTEKGILIST